MSAMNEVLAETRISKVKSGLEVWREVAIRVCDFLTWERDWYPAVTGGVVTAAFLSIWCWEPTLITLLATAGLVMTLTDYLGPKIISMVFGECSWDNVKERKFNGVCEGIVSICDNLEAAFSFCREARSQKPVVHFVATLGSLVALAWIGNRVNNIFLAYLLTLALVMLPGLHRRGLVKRQFSKIAELSGINRFATAKKVE